MSTHKRNKCCGYRSCKSCNVSDLCVSRGGDLYVNLDGDVDPRSVVCRLAYVLLKGEDVLVVRIDMV